MAAMTGTSEPRPPARPTRQIDTDRVRVTEWRFAPGAATGYHRHEFDYVVVPLTSGRLLLEEPEGKRFSELTAGVSYARSAGVEHDVINANDFEFAFIEIEIKT
jgi:beta-alanine degradation protein BauB